MPISPLLFFAPLVLAFEVWQLIIAERYVGVRQIKHHTDPRDLGPAEITAFLWLVGVFLCYLWMVLMLRPPLFRIQIVCMFLVSAVGYAVRRHLGLRWLLVVLTLEGALRIGMILSMLGLAWRQWSGAPWPPR